MTTEPLEDDDGWTEAHSASIPRVDLVGKAANGSGAFLLMKGQGGLISPDTVRDLIKQTPDEPERTTMTATILTGSPADVLKAIHHAPTRGETVPAPVAKAGSTNNTAANADAADAVSGDNTPLPDADELNAQSQESADGSGVPSDAPGDPDDPSSPAWEAVDAARARQALQLTIALQRLVAQSADREAQEVALSDDCDMDDVWTLEDVGAAISAIIDMLAPFAITEQAEADQGTADDMTKAARLIKAGRVLSSANEAKIRGAADALQAVLGSLPAAIDDAAPVAKNGVIVTEPTPTERHKTAAALFTKATAEEGWRIEKAASDGPVMAVYDASGVLVGTIDPADLSALAAPTPPPDAPADPAPAADVNAPADTDPEPSAEAGTPAAAPPAVPPAPDDTPVAKTTTDDDIDARVATLVKAALEENQTVIKGMQDEIAYLKAPAAPRVATNGAIPPAHLMRGQGNNADLSANDTIVADLKKSMASADPAVQNDAAKRLNEIAIASLTAMLGGNQ